MISDRMDHFEKTNKEKGFKYIAGLDEVGRGPLAGPVCSAAVVLPYPIPEELLWHVTDSKKLTSSKRDILYERIYEHALGIGIGVVSEEEVDRINILEATKCSMIQAVHNIKEIVPDLLLIDGNFKISLDMEQIPIVKGDLKSVSIAAASIIAKVFRDSLMSDFHFQYPEYNFKKNKGYGTKEHCEMIKKIGPSPIHRKSFKKVMEYVVL